MVLNGINHYMEKVMRKIQMVDLKGQYEKIKPEVDSAIQNVIYNTTFINGPEVKTFAADFERYLNVKHVIPCPMELMHFRLP